MANVIIPYVNDFAEAEQAGANAKFVGIEENPYSQPQPIPIVYGRRRVEGIRLWTHVPSTNINTLYCIYALSEGWCSSINTLYVDDVDTGITNLSHRTPKQVTTGKYAGILEVEFIDGRGGVSQYSSATDVNVGPSQIIQRDLFLQKYWPRLCFLVCKFTYSDPSPYRNIPKVSVDMYGRRVATISSTPGYISYATVNPIEILWDLLFNSTYGGNIGYDKQDNSSWTTAAAYCENTTDFGYKSFTCDWICDTGNTLLDNVRYLLDTYNINLTLSQGKFAVSLESSPSDSDTPSGGLTFNESNIIGNISIQYPNISSKFNKVIVDYPDRINNYQTRSRTYPETTTNTFLAEDNNILLEQRFSADTITEFWQAARLAQMYLRRSRTMNIYRLTVDKTGHRLRVGDYIFINTTYPSLVNKKVIIVSMTLNDDYTFDLECVDYLATNYPPGFTDIPGAPDTSNQQIPGGGGVTPAPVPSPTPPAPVAPAQTFAVNSNGSVFNEGASVTFTLTTTGVSNGTTVNWELVGPTSSDITPTALTGTLTINSNSATYTLTIQQDATTEGQESWVFYVKNSSNGQVLAQSVITVQDTSLTPAPAAYVWTYTNALFIDTVNTSNNLAANNDWYITHVDSSGTFNIAEVSNNGTTVPTFTNTVPPGLSYSYINRAVRQRIMKNATFNYCTLDIDFTLVDRKYSAQTANKQIFCVYDNWTQYKANPTATYLRTYARAINQQLLQFNYEAPPTGQYTLRSNLVYSTQSASNVQGWEDVRNTSTSAPIANDIPGCVRLLPVTGKAGHYSTNTSQTSSGRNTIKFAISVGTNRNFVGATATDGRNCYTGPITLDSTHASTNAYVRLHFFEVDRTTFAIVPIGQKIIAVGLNRGNITSKYYAESRALLTSTIGTTANPMPA